MPEISTTKLNAKQLSADLRSRATNAKTVLSVNANVTNSGKIRAEEVVQLYIGLRGTSVEEPMRTLKAFERVALAPGETKKVTFALTPEAFALWDIHNALTVEPSRVRVWVSPDSQHGQPVELDITE